MSGSKLLRVWALPGILLASLWLQPLWGTLGHCAWKADRSVREVFPVSLGHALIGSPQQHTIRQAETLLDIARHYDLGINEIQDLFPAWDPWIPPVGARFIIPTLWVLPESPSTGIVINVAELRLYFFFLNGSEVVTFPIAIGDSNTPTPTGLFQISTKLENPSWTIPPSLRYKHGSGVVPPGPDNPLGAYWMGLGDTRYGIHGSNTPWSIGRLVTNGCIRLYPEDIAWLFQRVDIGTPVKIIYEPVKIAVMPQRVIVEVHRDVYARTLGLVGYGLSRLEHLRINNRVDLQKYRQALKSGNGFPLDVTRPAP